MLIAPPTMRPLAATPQDGTPQKLSGVQQTRELEKLLASYARCNTVGTRTLPRTAAALRVGS